MASRVSVVAVRGPLQGAGGPFSEALARQGYTPLSAANQLRLLAHLSRWMVSESLSPGELTDAMLNRFLVARREAGYTGWLSQRGLRPLVGVLREMGLIPAAPAPAPSPLDALVGEFGVFLRLERGLAESTIESLSRIGRRFLAGREELLGELTAAEVAAYVVSTCPGMRVATARLEMTGLRTLLRFLHVSGRVAVDLSPAVLGAAGWRHAALPRGLGDTQVAALLSACDSSRPAGRRDRAVLLLLLRLGLRRIEVARLRLDDVDWRAGEIVITGKGKRVERLPLPVDVGEAVVDYLQRERPKRSGERALFLRSRAPHGPLTGPAVARIVRSLAGRAGIGPVGPHRLRHTVATAMLREGADLVEVGQLLRHRNMSTTAIYAKVDLHRLHRLARRWPRTVVAGVERAQRSMATPWPRPVCLEEVQS